MTTSSLVTVVLEIAVPLAAIGTVAMALLQAAKAALWAHGFFVRTQLRQFIPDIIVRDDLFRLACGEKEPNLAFFNQETKHLFEKLEAATQTVMDYPKIACNQPVFRFLTKGADADSQCWLEAAESIFQIPSRELSNREELLEKSRLAIEAKRRLTRLAKHRLEIIKQQIQQRWAWWNQISAVALGVLLVYLVSDDLFEQWAAAGFSSIKNTMSLKIIVATFGGIFAPFAKDIVNSLTGLRTKPMPSEQADGI